MVGVRCRIRASSSIPGSLPSSIALPRWPLRRTLRSASCGRSTKRTSACACRRRFSTSCSIGLKPSDHPSSPQEGRPFMTVAIIVLLVFAAVIAAILIMAAAKPDTFRVVRATSIKASPAKIFPAINDFQKWSAWSPYENKDPAMKRTFTGPTSGKGAGYAWEGNKNVGVGNMEITDSLAPAKVTLSLNFTRPFEAHNTVVFSLEPQGEMTLVTWAMQGPVPYIAKIMHVLVNMDKMVGKDFEIGLANLKAMAE